MRIISYIFLTFVILLGFTFACLNAEDVNINYYIGTSLLPLSLLLVITLIVGMLIGFLLTLSWAIKSKTRLYHSRNQVKKLEHELMHIKNNQQNSELSER